MKKKTILVTGAGSGIGMMSALVLAERGHQVIATTETLGQVESLKGFAAEKKLKMEIFVLDITKEKDRELVLNYDLDVLINDAGMGETGSLSEVPLERLRRVFETNVFSTIALTQLALKGMMKKKRGTVIVVSSVAGRIPTAFMGPYSMTKFALSGGMAALRTELHRVAPNVHVSLIEPGAYATGFNQKMFATKYEWMDARSYFHTLIPKLKKEDEQFKRIEEKSVANIVRKIVNAAESDKPRLRYVAPGYQALYVRIRRIFGV